MCAVTPSERQRPLVTASRCLYQSPFRRSNSGEALSRRLRRSNRIFGCPRTNGTDLQPRQKTASRCNTSGSREFHESRWDQVPDHPGSSGQSRTKGLWAASDAALRDRGRCCCLRLRRSAQGTHDRAVRFSRRTEGQRGACIFHGPDAQLSSARYGKHGTALALTGYPWVSVGLPATRTGEVVSPASLAPCPGLD
jgi:hypothetical protein